VNINVDRANTGVTRKAATRNCALVISLAKIIEARDVVKCGEMTVQVELLLNCLA